MLSTSRRKFIQSIAGVSSMGVGSYAWSSKPKKLGVALVGLGYYSRDLLAPSLQLTSHCELRGIVTGTPSKIPLWQKQYAIPDANVYNYENMHQIANNPDIDIVYIVLPTFLHMKYSVIAANAGKHVWCEKPMAMTVEECKTMIQSCNKNKVQLTIGYRLQHEPNTQTVAAFAKSRPYGAIKTLHADAGYSGSGAAADNWRMHQGQGGGALYDMGVYPINGVRFATGLEPLSIEASHEIHRPELFKNCDESSNFTLKFAGGIEAHCRASVGNNYNKMRVDCDKGWYELEPMQAYSGVKGRTSDGRMLNKPLANQQARQMDNDALAILGKGPIWVPGEQGMEDIRVVEAALRSVRLKKEVSI